MTLFNLPWYIFILFMVGEGLALWIFDRFDIIKSKQLRYAVVIFVFSFLFWVVYDIATGS